MAEPRPRRVLRDTGAESVRGIALVNICFLLLTLGDIATLIALPVAGVAGAVIGRGLFGGLCVAGVATLRPEERARGWRFVLPRRPGLVLVRGLIHAGASVTWYLSWHLGMPLAESYAIGYAAPLVMTLIAVPMLGERLTLRRIVATAIGFCGMLVMVRPGGALWTPLSLLLFVGVMGMSVSRTMARTLSTTETPECLAFWLMAMHVPVGVLMVLGGFPAPGVALPAVAGLLGLGLTNGVAHWLHSRAAALAPVGTLAPYEYTGMIWAVLLGFLCFGQVPAWSTMLGAAVVAAAGISNFMGEHRRSRAERAVAGGAGLAAAPAVAQRPDQ